jgi:hypothetical protein
MPAGTVTYDINTKAIKITLADGWSFLNTTASDSGKQDGNVNVYFLVIFSHTCSNHLVVYVSCRFFWSDSVQ